MLSGYPVACPQQDCEWTGNLVPSQVRGGADAEIAAAQPAWFLCPSCHRIWQMGIQGEKAVVLPVRVTGNEKPVSCGP
jgi:hypothetical protein